MIRYASISFFFLTAFLPSKAQQSDSSSLHKKTSKIEYVSEFITVKLSQNSDVETLSVLTNTNDIHLSPNTKSITKLSFNYKFISFTIRYIPPFLNGKNSNDLKGKTGGTGYSFNFNFNHWLQYVAYNKTKGYYLENTADYVQNWKKGDPYLQFPNLYNYQFQGITGYKFNPEYSISAVTTLSERQIKSAGSFIPYLFYRYYIINDKTPIVSNNSSQKTNNLEMILGLGYYHTFVLKRQFYLALGATPGAGFVHTKLTTRFPSGNNISKQNNGIFRLDTQAGMGYNGRLFFAGVYTKLSASSYNQQHTTAVNEDANGSIQLFVGYRFTAPKWIKDKLKYVSEKVSERLPLKL